ncbi:hypothetical protein CDD80_2763 [Ophiocordyceps camponoti-rufipedis]|uniref:Uncharacterized protein n=1 Tax=Ophiocordyceps camponoti-rufipedis TaxID=2004952 RepID=A0A2C5Z4Y6_9HYPO|nr:hypothetical protein CDD80_2763 [Ophiocordyceps camponoti-rufipedis]
MRVFSLLSLALLCAQQSLAAYNEAINQQNQTHSYPPSSLFKRQAGDIHVRIAVYEHEVTYLHSGNRVMQPHWTLHFTPPGVPGHTTYRVHARFGSESGSDSNFILENTMVDLLRQPRLITRLEVAKLPATVPMKDVLQLLSNNPLPKGKCTYSGCKEWVERGLKSLKNKAMIHELHMTNIDDIEAITNELDKYAKQQHERIWKWEGERGQYGRLVISPPDTQLQQQIVRWDAGKKTFAPVEPVPRVEPSPDELVTRCRRDAIDCFPGRQYEVQGGNQEAPRKLTHEELNEHYNRFAKDEFYRLMDESGHGHLLDKPEKPLRYELMRNEVKPAVTEGVRLKVGDLAGGALAVVGIALWAKEMVDVFSRNSSTAWEQADVATAIIPFVGCAVRIADQVDHGKATTTDVLQDTLCVTSDLLLLTPAWPLGVFLQVFSLALSWSPSPDPERSQWFGLYRKPDNFHKRRLQAWDERRQEVLNETLSAPDYHKNLQTQYTSEQLALLYSASHAAGAMRAATLHAAETVESRQNISQTDDFVGRQHLRKTLCHQLLQRKARLAADVETHMREHMETERDRADDVFFSEAGTWLAEHVPRDPERGAFSSRKSPPYATSQQVAQYIDGLRKQKYEKGPLLTDDEAARIRYHVDQLNAPAFCQIGAFSQDE